MGPHGTCVLGGVPLRRPQLKVVGISALNGVLILSKLPAQYRILPETVEFRLPGFDRWYRPGNSVLAPVATNVAEWFEEFAEEIVGAVGRRHLPVVRLSDGEYLLLFGRLFASTRAPLAERLRVAVRVIKFRLNPWARVVARSPGYESGAYTPDEVRRLRDDCASACRRIAGLGYLAVHLEHGQDPFVEQYFPALARWLSANGIELTMSTYVPFYFVYALLASPHRERLLRDRNVLIVTHAEASKRDRVEQTLEDFGTASVSWFSISKRRSAFDRLDLSRWELRQFDLAFVGGGLGAPLLIEQLGELEGPVLDVGYMLEVWADPDARHDRPYATT